MFKKTLTTPHFLLFMCMGLSACAVGPDYVAPTVEIPTEYMNLAKNQTAVDANASLEWWELFDDPNIDALVHTALEHNQDVRIALARIDEARAQMGYTDADRYPSFYLYGTGTKSSFTLGSDIGANVSSYSIAPVASWEIDFWGKFRRASESAQASMIATQYGTRAVYLKLISDVIGTYFTLLENNAQLQIAKDTLASRMDSLTIIKARFDKGIVPELDVNQAEIQKEIAVTAISSATRYIQKSESLLSVLLGQMPKHFSVSGKSLYTTNAHAIPTGLTSNLLLKRPDILEAEQNLKAQNAQIGVAVAQRFPSISLTGGIGYASNDLGSLLDNSAAWSIGASFLGPIFQFGKNRSRVEIQRARTEQTIEQYEKVVISAFRDVENTLIDLKTYKNEVASNKRKLKNAKRATELSELRYDKGIASYLEYLDAQRTLFSVELEYAQVRKKHLTTYITLYTVLGGGWVSEEAKLNAQQDRQAKPKDVASTIEAKATNYTHKNIRRR